MTPHHKKRLITAAFLLPLLYIIVMILPIEFFTFMIAVFTFLAFYEFLTMYRVSGTIAILTCLIGVIPIILTYFYRGLTTWTWALLFFAITIVRLFIKKDTGNALKDISPLFIGFIYLPVNMTFFIRLHKIAPAWVIFLCLMVWGADSCAYYIGKGYGRRKLYESVSPNKTMEGAYAAIVGALVISLLLKVVLHLPVSYYKMLFIGPIIGFSGIVGDLLESMFKRDAGIKDSSSLIPGHGGFLDKLDGMLLSAPVLYCLIHYFVY